MGAAYSDQIVAIGGTDAYIHVVSRGQLPLGLTLNPNTGEIRGTPTSPGLEDFDVTITDASLTRSRLKAGGTTVYNVTHPFSINVAPAGVVPSTLTPVPSLGAMGLLMLNAAALMLGIRVIRRQRQTGR